MKDQVLFPKIEVSEKGFLQVSDIHTIYWERSGNPNGKKILVIHGGPGGGSQPRYRRTLTRINSILFNLTKEVAVLQLLSPNYKKIRPII